MARNEENSRELEPDRVNDRYRAKRALQMHMAGATFAEIAEQLGYYDRSTACRAVTEQVRKIGRAEAREKFDMDMARLDKLQLSVWPAAMRGDLQAVKQVVEIIRERSRICGYANGAALYNPAEEAATTEENQVGPSSLAEVLGTDSDEVVQNMARVLHDFLPQTAGSDE